MDESEERYQIWEPLPEGLSGLLVCSLIDDKRGLTIRLGSNVDRPTVEIVFDAQSAYRNVDESYRRGLPEKCSASLPHSLYTVENSRWLHWFHSESNGAYADTEFVHFSVITAADCLDVISEFLPDVRYVR